MGSRIKHFYDLDEASIFFIDTAFKHIQDAFIMERAHSIFATEIMKVDAPVGWVIPKFPDSLEDILNFDEEILPDTTIDELTKCWHYSQAKAIENHEIRLPKNHKVQSIEVVGHIINLHACVETTLNRHLFYLKSTEKINGDIFNSLDRTEFIPKLLFIFKDEILNNEIKIQPFRLLNSLRNKAVHFKKDSRDSIKPSVTELLSIWREVGLLLMHTSGDPNGNSILNYTKYLAEKFFSIKETL